MDKYIVDKFKGIYRIKAEYDLEKNDYPRDSEGNLDQSFGDFYIACQHGNKITRYGGKIFQVYIPSLGRGRNIIKKLEEMGKQDIVIKYIETDQEVIFNFHMSNMELVAELCKAKTSGANISPFSVKNLPRDKPKWNKYEPKDKELYDEMIDLLKQWVSKQGVRLGDAYQKMYVDFSEEVEMDLVGVSKETNYKVLHVIDRNGLTQKLIKWIQEN